MSPKILHNYKGLVQHMLLKEAEESAPKMVKEKPDLDPRYTAFFRVRPNERRSCFLRPLLGTAQKPGMLPVLRHEVPTA